MKIVHLETINYGDECKIIKAEWNHRNVVVKLYDSDLFSKEEKEYKFGEEINGEMSIFITKIEYKDSEDAIFGFDEENDKILCTIEISKLISKGKFKAIIGEDIVDFKVPLNILGENELKEGKKCKIEGKCSFFS